QRRRGELSMPQSMSARIFVALIVVLGFLLIAEAIRNAHSLLTIRFAAFLVLAALAGRLQVKLPGGTGSKSMDLAFVLLSVALRGGPEAAIVAFISSFAQSLPRGKQRLNPAQLAFNCSAITLAAVAARFIYAAPVVSAWVGSPGLRLAVAAAGYFLVN